MRIEYPRRAIAATIAAVAIFLIGLVGGCATAPSDDSASSATVTRVAAERDAARRQVGGLRTELADARKNTAAESAKADRLADRVTEARRQRNDLRRALDAAHRRR